MKIINIIIFLIIFIIVLVILYNLLSINTLLKSETMINNNIVRDKISNYINSKENNSHGIKRNLCLDNKTLLYNGNYHAWNEHNFVKKTNISDIRGSSEKLNEKKIKNYPTRGNVIPKNIYNGIFKRKEYNRYNL